MASLDPSKPILFAAMPFGEKPEPDGPRVVDFDAVYTNCVKPAAESVDLSIIRADEETLGGIIHRPMYERLLLAEIVVADLTFANPNVFYELGVRHAARPRSTILIYAKINQLPFDVHMIRAIPYELDDDGEMLDPAGLRNALRERLELAKRDEAVDSPLFQLLENYPGISLSHEVTEAFRDRAVWLSGLTIRANEAAKNPADFEEAQATLLQIEKEAASVAGSEEQLLVTLILAYRSISAWDDMIRIAESLPANLSRVPTVREQHALALSRRNSENDRNRAIAIINQVIDEHGESPEALGILGRCFKSRWQEKVEAKDPGASDALDAAIAAYERGFEADPRDFYPGVNLVTLLARRGNKQDMNHLAQLAPVVAFAVARKGGLKSRDYWTVATVLEMAVVEGDEVLGRRALSAMLDADSDLWMRETTANNLEILIGGLSLDGTAAKWIEEVVATLREK